MNEIASNLANSEFRNQFTEKIDSFWIEAKAILDINVRDPNVDEPAEDAVHALRVIRNACAGCVSSQSRFR
jgi:hypothetical protein